MKPINKRRFLYSLGGLFGWAWLACSIYGIYALGDFLFSTGQLSSAIYAFIASAISGWISKSFYEKDRQLAYVTALINKGIPEHAADEAWVNLRNKKSDLLAELEKEAQK